MLGDEQKSSWRKSSKEGQGEREAHATSVENLGNFCSFSARRWDLTEPQRNCPLFRKDLSQAVTYQGRNYTHCTKQKHRQGLQQMHICIANCSCVPCNTPITRWDSYILHDSLPFPYGKSTLKYVHMAKPTFFQHMFQKTIMNLTEMLTMLSIFLKSPTPGFLWLHEKNPIAAIKKKYKFTQGEQKHFLY